MIKGIFKRYRTHLILIAVFIVLFLLFMIYSIHAGLSPYQALFIGGSTFGFFILVILFVIAAGTIRVRSILHRYENRVREHENKDNDR